MRLVRSTTHLVRVTERGQRPPLCLGAFPHVDEGLIENPWGSVGMGCSAWTPCDTGNAVAVIGRPARECFVGRGGDALNSSAGGEAELRLFVAVANIEDATRAAAAVAKALGPHARVLSTGVQPYWKIPEWWEIMASMRVPGDGEETLAVLQTALGSGWDSMSTPDEVEAIWTAEKGDFVIPTARWCHLQVFPATPPHAFNLGSRVQVIPQPRREALRSVAGETGTVVGRGVGRDGDAYYSIEIDRDRCIYSVMHDDLAGVERISER